MELHVRKSLGKMKIKLGLSFSSNASLAAAENLAEMTRWKNSLNKKAALPFITSTAPAPHGTVDCCKCHKRDYNSP